MTNNDEIPRWNWRYEGDQRLEEIGDSNENNDDSQQFYSSICQFHSYGRWKFSECCLKCLEKEGS